MTILNKIVGVVTCIDEWLYTSTVATKLNPFEEARIRLNLRLTWIFCLSGLIYSSSFIADRRFFVVGFGSTISLLLILLPITIKFGYNKLRQTLYFLTIIFFIVVNILGVGQYHQRSYRLVDDIDCTTYNGHPYK